jgi:phasin family protein
VTTKPESPVKGRKAPAAKPAKTEAAPVAAKAPATVSLKAVEAPRAETPVQQAVAPAPAAEAPAPAPAAASQPEAPARPRVVLKSVPTTPAPLAKETIMATAFETTQEAVKTTVQQLNTTAEAAIESSKAAIEQVTAKSREAVETGMKTLDEMTDMARGNVEAMMASARAASTGFEAITAHVTEVSRKSFEEVTAITKSIAAAKSPNELMQLQTDFAKTQFDAAVAELSKMTEMMMKISGDVMEPVQNRFAIATDKMKTVLVAK